jgi:hypothetical protein
VKASKPHTVVVYFAADDAHSYVLLKALLQFVKQYNVYLDFRVLSGGHGHSVDATVQR